MRVCNYALPGFGGGLGGHGVDAECPDHLAHVHHQDRPFQDLNLCIGFFKVDQC